MPWIKKLQCQWAARPYLCIFIAAIVMRLMWMAIACIGMYFQVHLERFWHMGTDGMGYFHTPIQLIDIWARWDAIHYLAIAENGYACPTSYSCTAFFPLFPLLIRCVQSVTGFSYLAVGLLLANAFDVASWLLLGAWLRQRLDTNQSFWAMLAFIFFPTRNFGFSVYTESLFLLLSLVAVLAFEHRQLWRACLAAALASGLRPQGIIVGLALTLACAWACWHDRKEKGIVYCWARMLPLTITPIGLVAYIAYLQNRFEQPLLFLESQKIWHRHWVWPWQILGVHADPFEYVVLIGACLLAIKMWQWRAPVVECFYVTLSLLIPMSTGSLTSINRFVGVLFPLFAWSAKKTIPRWLWRLYWLLCLVYMCVFAIKLGQGAKVI